MFHFDLPPHLIAQHPSERRDRSRLLVARRSDSTLSRRHFADLPDLLAPGDLLVLNDTKVIPARLLGHRSRTGGKWEGLFLREAEGGTWELLCRTRGRLIEGEEVAVEGEALKLTYLGRAPGGASLWRPGLPGAAHELLEQFGHVPLPPYIRKGRDGAEDRERYQTVYARTPGAVAAPTAGLHFTDEVLARLAGRGVERAYVTLHVGWGTFAPLQGEDHRTHKMHAEWGRLPAETAAAVARCRARGGRVVAVGTTSARVLESVAAAGPLQAWSGETSLYIYPPYEFRAVDAMVTNFHLPGTTLLLLVAALAGEDLMRRAYEAAIAEGYRFYSYGDAMLIL